MYRIRPGDGAISPHPAAVLLTIPFRVLRLHSQVFRSLPQLCEVLAHMNYRHTASIEL
jgi:hypothetical protein